MYRRLNQQPRTRFRCYTAIALDTSVAAANCPAN